MLFHGLARRSWFGVDPLSGAALATQSDEAERDEAGEGGGACGLGDWREGDGVAAKLIHVERDAMRVRTAAIPAQATRVFFRKLKVGGLIGAKINAIGATPELDEGPGEGRVIERKIHGEHDKRIVA